MSASPSGGPNGQTPTPPQGKGLLPRMRKSRNDNPLRPRQKPQPRPAGIHAPGTPMPAASKGAPARPAAGKPQLKAATQGQPNFEALRQQNGGWSFPLRADMQEWDLVLTKKGISEGLRSHVMKLVPPSQRSQHKGVDPTDQDEFTRPVLLHRRDPRQPPPGRAVKEPTPEETTEQTAEAEKLKQLKADREAQRAIDDAQKAPTGAPTKKNQPKQKEKPQGTKVNHGPRTQQQKKESEIRYEEALPWHLEDADGKNVWVGQYEQPLSDTKVAIMFREGKFAIIPLEKWYKFSSKRASVNALSIEEAEKLMGRKAPVSRWAQRDEQLKKTERAMAESRGRIAVKQESQTYKQASRAEKMENDDIDVSGDEFQDDDETAGFEADRDDDTRESKDKIRREQLGANLFGDADERTVEKEEGDRMKEELERKLFGKDMKKSLKRRDKQFQYDDSDDSERERDPFASSSESDSESDEDEVKKEEDKDSKDKVGASGTSSKGTNTPQGKKALADAAKKGKSLKRPGSPMASDSSGTESTRKNKKKKTGPSTASLTGSRSTTPMPGGLARRPGAGSASDAEATGGEMSDGVGGKKKKKKMGTHLGTGTGAKGTPAGSRAGSPNPAASGNATNTKDFAGTTPHSLDSVPLTEQEIIDALPNDPANGIPLTALTGIFKNRLSDRPGHLSKQDMIRVVKQHSVWNKETKLLSRKKTA
ncbi:hypothetical protein BJ170DRAFT_679921 [Xylariales sp. AK1849]|nr:hypothetical protein BJ170DRAFT_679921 [Xylariales sp. AK1849]